jgi:hypothetical protein
MSLVILEVPDDVLQLPAWLEAELVGLRLRDLMSELSVVHRVALRSTSSEELETWLGTDRAAVLDRGLGALPAERFSDLLKRPHFLPALQELVLLEGGSYWQNLLDTVGRAAGASELRDDADPPRRLGEPPHNKPVGRAAGPSLLNVGRAAGPSEPINSPSRIVPRALAYGVLALAACLLVAVGVSLYRTASGAPTWGWNAPDLLAAKPGETPREHLAALAAAAEDWFDQPRDTTDELTTRIREMRSGCDRLIADAHPALAAEDRQWLVQKCRDWRDKFDAQLAALQRGAPAAQVRDEMDKAVHTLIQKLNERADSHAA